MISFQGFKPSGIEKIANAMGFQGEEKDFQKFLEENPDRQAEMLRYQDIARKMVSGGYVNKMQEGGTPAKKSIRDISLDRVTDPKVPTGATVSPFAIPTGDAGQTVPTTSGQVSTTAPQATAKTADTALAETPAEDPRTTTTMQADTAVDKVTAVTEATEAAKLDPNDPRSKVTAAEATKSAVSDLDAAQGTAIKLENPVQREIQDGELVEPVANAEKAAKFTEQIQAATATPTEKATVQGQLASLTANFDATNPPAWAAGALRGVQAQMQARGLGASSIAGQALIQASLESALPIAMADAQTVAKFEAQNLSNTQQRAMLAAEQRASFIGMEFTQEFQARVQNAAKVSDVANMNFTAEQQIALENSRIANTVNLQNLSNRQAKVMAEASALANLDMANLNNRQMSAVQNAQNFMQRDMANLSNQQQTELFRLQQRIQSLFTDQAAENASRQFNATSENQTKQFFAQLDTQVSQFNASQANAQAQFNAGQENAVSQFNTEIRNQRDQFNANNRLVIDQNNAQWRRQIATADTAAVNRANEINAQNLLGISNTAYNNLWQYYSDAMQYAWTSAENERDRVKDLAVAHLDADNNVDIQKMQNDYNSSVGFGKLIGAFMFGSEFLFG
ncbi:hypothetical protein [uncultured virus]|uniref:Uncharacterized protein n=1 Tax=uncultured virus TaxID=340016 RepID=A0A218MLD3_9VIRU|nr:hypothetical protein [uncultured virus]